MQNYARDISVTVNYEPELGSWIALNIETIL